MDKKTLLAVVLSVVVIVGGMLLQPVLFPKKPAQPATSSQPSAGSPAAEGSQPAAQAPAAQSGAQGQQPAQGQAAPSTQGTTAAVPTGSISPVPFDAAQVRVPSPGETIVRETDLYRLTFTADGGSLVSAQLKKFRNVDGSLVDMILKPKDGRAADIPFAIGFGDYKSAQRQEPFAFRESTDAAKSTFEFSRAFYSTTGVPFTLKKAYVFARDEYLFELQVTIENSVNDVPAIDVGGFAYTLSLGPQIGPSYKKLDGRNELRAYAYWADGKRQDPKVAVGAAGVKELDKNLVWAGITGKYFAAIANPLLAVQYRTVFDSRKTVEGFDRSVIHFERPVQRANAWTDKYRFYLGPLKKDILSRYNSAEKNGFGVSDLHADAMVTSSPLIGWLADLMKLVLELFYRLIPNYGVAIILLTLATKLIFLPLTFKSSESTAKMAALNPKMQEIRTRLKDKPDKMNQEIAALYKREKVSPLSGCLPLLLQLPIFFALYALLNGHFELRGALFIPGWIPDLSAPESVLDFGFTIPLVNWTSLRLLPLIMLGTQLLSSKFTQPAGAGQQQSAGQMKLMTYGLPIVFLFILYDMPSGLVLYWTVQNVLSTAQQLYINWRNKVKGARAAAAASPPAVKK
jgi:YidC/Oxa1 family membrane protein insertase